MERDEKTPLLLRFYFGEAAGRAQGGASRRLLKWSRAFEEWKDEQRGQKRRDTVKHALLAWRRLLGQTAKMPWQLEREDIESHMSWLREQGFADSTMNAAAGFIGGFYEWCAGRRIDPACGEGFNPARGIIRTSRKPYAGASVWSRGEVEALLGLVRRDETGLGRRDLALFTARLGVALNKLLGLRWGQIRQAETGASSRAGLAWVRWRAEGDRVRLPGDAWEAMEAYLRASGRYERMTSGTHIFVPLVQPSVPGLGERAEDWSEGQHLSNQAAGKSLKLYGRRVGIEEGKLNMTALRRTAIWLRMEAGASVEEMQVFMDTREKVKSTRYRLRCLMGKETGSERPPSQPPPIEIVRKSGHKKCPDRVD